MYRILVILIVVWAIGSIVNRFRQGVVSRRRLVVMTMFWIAVAVLGLMPAETDEFVSKLGIRSGANFFFFFAILLLLYLAFTMYVRIDHLQREITDLVRALALKEMESSRGISAASETGHKVAPPRGGPVE